MFAVHLPFALTSVAFSRSNNPIRINPCPVFDGRKVTIASLIFQACHLVISAILTGLGSGDDRCMASIRIKITAETARLLLEATETIDGVNAFRASLEDALKNNIDSDEPVQVTIQ